MSADYVVHGNVAVITLNRPEAGNALNPALGEATPPHPSPPGELSAARSRLSRRPAGASAGSVFPRAALAAACG